MVALWFFVKKIALTNRIDRPKRRSYRAFEGTLTIKSDTPPTAVRPALLSVQSPATTAGGHRQPEIRWVTSLITGEPLTLLRQGLQH